MPASSPPRGAERRALIVESARRRIVELGYDATTIGDLASELGISKAAIAYYFPTKDQFLDEFAGPLLEELEEAVDQAGCDAEAVLRAYLDVLIRQRDLAVWVDTDPAIAREPRLGDRMSAVNAKVVAVITGRSRRKADRVRALTALGSLWRPVREIAADDLDGHRDDLVTAALAGYAATADA